jgi:hypothetical protein
MSIKERSKRIEQRVVRGSKSMGRDVKKGLVRAGRDVERAGKRVGTATRHGMTRADDRLRPNRRGKA